MQTIDVYGVKSFSRSYDYAYVSLREARAHAYRLACELGFPCAVYDVRTDRLVETVNP